MAALIGGIYLVWPGAKSTTVVGYFSSAVGLYPGDDIRIVGVPPVGTIAAIEPQPQAVKITMSLNNGIRVPADAHAIIVAPNLVSARFIQLTPPAYTGGQAMADGATIGPDRTGVPVEWDEVKEELTKLSRTLARKPEPRVRCRNSSIRPPTPSTVTATRSGRRCASYRKRPAALVIREPICSEPCEICKCSSTPCPTATSKSSSSPVIWPR